MRGEGCGVDEGVAAADKRFAAAGEGATEAGEGVAAADEGATEADEGVAAAGEEFADAGEGFAAFVRERGDHHLRVAVLLTGDWHAAEDLVQASLVKLYRVWPRLDTRADPDPYLRRIMVNTQRSWWRARWRREMPAARLSEGSGGTGIGGTGIGGTGIGGTGIGGDDFADRQALGVLVRQALAGLPRQQRAVLVLRYCEDLSEAEVAGILGCSPGTVKTHAHRGINALREILGSEFGPLEVNETRPSRRDSG
jgi:RNA polymerase sigma factor (sigma-70 family)